MAIEVGKNVSGSGSPAKSAQISAVITRADGRVEEVGVVSYWHRNPLLNAWGNLKIKLREMRRAR